MRTFTQYAPGGIRSRSAVIAFGLVAGLTVACGKKDKGSDAPAPVVDTSVTSAEIADGAAKIRYKSTVPDANFKCQLETNGNLTEWSDCPSEGTSIQLEPGKSYTFRVKAVGPGGIEDKEPATYSFVAPGDTNTGNPGVEPPMDFAALILNKNMIPPVYNQADMVLELGVDGGPSINDVVFECKTAAQTTFGPCTGPDSYEFRSMVDGQIYGLTVRALLKSNGMPSREDYIRFQVELADEPIDEPGEPNEPNEPVETLNPVFLVGAHYTVAVPEGMHVQQYSSNINFNSAMNFYRISVESDPYAIGNDRCIGEWDMITAAKSPSGNVYQYCNSTDPQVVHDYKMERRFANNHLQIATDPELIASGQAAHEVILFNMYTRYSERFYTESRFAALCGGAAIDGMRGLNPIRATNYRIPLANGFFAYQWQDAVFYTCDVIMPAAGPNWGQPQVWKIGAFYMVDRDQPVLDMTCGGCVYPGKKSLLEVVYMSRNTMPDALFAQQAQELFLRSLAKARP